MLVLSQFNCTFGFQDEHTPDQIKLMQTQDIRYVTMKLTTEKRKIARLQSELHMLDAAAEVRKIKSRIILQVLIY